MWAAQQSDRRIEQWVWSVRGNAASARGRAVEGLVLAPQREQGGRGRTGRPRPGRKVSTRSASASAAPAAPGEGVLGGADRGSADVESLQLPFAAHRQRRRRARPAALPRRARSVPSPTRRRWIRSRAPVGPPDQEAVGGGDRHRSSQTAGGADSRPGGLPPPCSSGEGQSAQRSRPGPRGSGLRQALSRAEARRAGRSNPMAEVPRQAPGLRCLPDEGVAGLGGGIRTVAHLPTLRAAAPHAHHRRASRKARIEGHASAERGEGGGRVPLARRLDQAPPTPGQRGPDR